MSDNKETDIIGRVYEYFLCKFADMEGKGGGEFYTLTSVVKTLVVGERAIIMIRA